MTPIEKRTRERIEKNNKIRLFKSVLWNIKEVELKILIKDILETEVDSKYYLSPLLQERFKKYLEDKENLKSETLLGYSRDSKGETINLHEKDVSNTIKSCQRINQQNLIYEGGDGKIQDVDGVCNCLEGGTSGGGGTSNRPMVFDNSQNKPTEEIYEVNKENDLVRPSYVQFQNGNHSEAHRVYNPDGISQTMKQGGLKIYAKLGDRFGSCNNVLSTDSISQTLSASMGMGGGYVPKISNSSPRECGFKDISPTLLGRDYKDPKIVSGQLRRLTPKECFRLMGFLNDEINLDGLSDTQRYKLAGNGWEINLASKILSEMLK